MDDRFARTRDERDSVGLAASDPADFHTMSSVFIVLRPSEPQVSGRPSSLGLCSRLLIDPGQDLVGPC